jgi:hypothetical protein
MWFWFVVVVTGVLAYSTAEAVSASTQDVLLEVGLILMTAAGLLALHELAPVLQRLTRRRSSPGFRRELAYSALWCLIFFGATYALRRTDHVASASAIVLALSALISGGAVFVLAWLLTSMTLAVGAARRRLETVEARRAFALGSAALLLVGGSALQWLSPLLSVPR